MRGFKTTSAGLIVLGIIILILVILGFGILVKALKLGVKIILHMILGWILLFLVNLIPFINIPINLLTILIAGFGGVIGVILLLILQLIGLF
ncbi:MAG: pro-sigmaK processing inhibitor BofA family protein [Methanobacteriaceae archaeon]|nr:pro-sigmaK processing inhibitor BofA family protein [Methanobacteriaceae archaeon]